MYQKVEIDIASDKESIWKVITNIENATDTISGIQSVEILEKPENALVGLKWKETRMMFGKPAVETMWITEAKENEYYQTRAENHGAIYISRFEIKPKDGKSTLSMEFRAETTTMVARFFSEFFGPLMKKSMKKICMRDLEDIRNKVEENK